MTLKSQDNLAATDYCMLLELEWGTTTARYTTWTDDVVANTNTFTSDPTLEIKSGELTGGVEDRPFMVTMDASLPPNDTLMTFGAHAPVTVTIYECSPSDVASTLRTLWKGGIGKKVKNPSGRRDLIRFEVQGLKRNLEISLGMMATTTCNWRYGNDECGLTPNTETGDITLNHDGIATRIDVTWDVGTPDESNDLWRRGHVEYDGLRILIRKSNEDGSFDLARVPPPEWDNQNVTFTEGCDGTIAVCRLRNNESQFAGFGISIPARNPVFQSGE